MASSPNWALYYTPSPAEWAAAFSGKVDVGGDASSNTVVPTGGTAPVTLAAIAAAVPAVSSGNVLGNSGASSAMPYDCTLSALIDRALGASEGSILCRGPTAWVALTPGASGQVLITGGPGAAPSWAAGAATLPDLRAVGEVHLYDPQWGGHFSTPLAAAIAGITQATNGVVTTRQPHGWASGQSIVLNSIGGMTALNGATVTIAVLSATAFSIGVNTTGYSAYTGGGVAVPTAGTIQDDAPAILAAAASFNGHGGTIRVGAGKAIYIGSNCLLPPGVSIEGPFPNPGAVVSNDSNNYTPYTAIIISPSATLSLGESGAIRNCLIYPQGMVWPVPGVAYTGLSGWTGTAITAAGDSWSVERCVIVGFEYGVYNSGYSRGRVLNCCMDNLTDIESSGSTDTEQFCFNHIWCFTTDDGGPDGVEDSGGTARQVGINLSNGNGRGIVTHNLIFGPTTGISLTNCGGYDVSHNSPEDCDYGIWLRSTGATTGGAANLGGTKIAHNTLCNVVNAGIYIDCFQTPMVIISITQANPGVVTFGAAHNLTTGEKVALAAIGGMTALNGATVYVTVVSSTQVAIGVNTTGYSAYTSGGTATLLSIQNPVSLVGNQYWGCAGDGVLISAESDASLQISIAGGNSMYNGCGINCLSPSVRLTIGNMTFDGNSPNGEIVVQYATFTGTISGTTLTASAFTYGTLQKGMLVEGGPTLPRTYITGFGTGTGGAGTYTVSLSQSVSSVAMQAATPAIANGCILNGGAAAGITLNGCLA